MPLHLLNDLAATKKFSQEESMPVSRLISDLDRLITDFSIDGPVASPILDELRLTVARINELRRQLDIAQLKLASVLSLAGMKVIERQVESDITPLLFNNRFKAPEDLSTGITEIDEAHRALFQSGNRLYWLALQRDVKAREVDVALTRLIQCAKTAFAIEEQMMGISGYARFDQHRAIHQRMKDYLSEMQELVSIQPLAVVVKLERFLGSWFLWHLQRDDVNFSRYHLLEQQDLPRVSSMLDQNSNTTMLTDPVCGTPVTDTSPHRFARGGAMFFFCSEACRSRFNIIADPLNYINDRMANLDSPAPTAEPPSAVVNKEPAIPNRGGTAHNPVRELGYLFRGQISSWLNTWRERRHVARTSRAMLSQYRSISASHPHLDPNEIYRFVVMAYTGCDTAAAGMILNRAEESFAEWPVRRALKLRDVVHYLTVTEYLDLYGKDFGMRSEIKKMVASHIPNDL